MKASKLMATLLAVGLLLSSLAACGEDPPPDQGFTGTVEPLDPVDTAPVEVPNGKEELEAAANAFSALTTATEADVETSSSGSGITILSYKGSAEKLLIPSTLGGKTVLGIADGAFRDNKNLRVLVLPATLTALGEGILSGCDALTALETPLIGKTAKDAQYLGYLFGADSYRNNPRDVPTTLKHLRLTQAHDTLPAYALYECNDLVTVELPSTLKKVEKFAFYGCTRLSVLKGSETVTSFGEYALADCSSLTHLDCGTGLASMGLGVLQGCKKLTSLTLPFIGETSEKNPYLGYLFGAESPDFSKGFYPAALSRVELLAGCTSLGNYTFFECETLREVVLPEGLLKIGVRAFYGCTALWSVKLPHTLRSVRENAFYGCESLLSVEFGTGLEELGINCFYDCIRLSAVKLPATLKSLPASAFAGCASLSAVDLGGVKSIGKNAFRHCHSIKTVAAAEGIEIDDGNAAITAILYPED